LFSSSPSVFILFLIVIITASFVLMFFDFTEREKDGAGDIKSRAVGARTLLVERRKEEPMGMSGPLSRTVKLKTDRYIFLFLRVLKFLLCPQPTKNLASHPFKDNRLHHNISQGGLIYR